MGWSRSPSHSIESNNAQKKLFRENKQWKFPGRKRVLSAVALMASLQFNGTNEPDEILPAVNQNVLATSETWSVSDLPFEKPNYAVRWRFVWLRNVPAVLIYYGGKNGTGACW